MARPRSSRFVLCPTHAELVLGRGDVCLVSLQDVEEIDKHGWHLNPYGYVASRFYLPEDGARTRLIHRYILREDVLKSPRAVVDHINGNRLDNRRENLRLVNDSLNAFNQRRINPGGRGRSGVNGVCFENFLVRKPWRASIKQHYKNISLGRYATVEEAIVARRAAEMKLFGEYSPEQNAKNNLL